MKLTSDRKLILFHLFCFLLLTVIAYRKILLGSGVLGHNWDWILPYFPEQLSELSKYGKYLWYEYALGTSASVAQTSSIIYIIAGFIGGLGLSGVFYTKALVIYVSLLSSISFYYLVRFFIKNSLQPKSDAAVNWAAFFSALYYGFSPYLFNELNGGASSKLFSYPLVPLFVLSSLYYIKSKGYFNFSWLISSLLVLLVAAAFQNLLLATVFLGSFVLYFSVQDKSVVPVLKAALIYILFVLLSSFWIFPLVSTYKYAVSEFVEKSLFNESSLVYNIPQWFEILVGTGYFREFFTFSSSTLIRSYLFVFGFSIIGFIVYALYTSKKNGSKIYYTFSYFMFYYLLAIIPAVSGRAPFGQYVIYLYRHIGFLNLFRSPQHFIFQVTLALSLLIGLGVYVLHINLDKKYTSKFLLGLIIVFLVFLNGYFIRGDLASSHFKTFRSAGNYVDLFRYPESYRTLFKKIAEDKSSTNTAFMPSGYSPYYMKNDYQHYGQGGDPFMLSFPHPYIANTSIRSVAGLQLIEKIEDQLNSIGLNDDTFKYMSMAGIKHLVLRDDVIVNFGNYSLLDTYNFVKSSLDKKLNSTSYDHMTLYDIPPAPRIYATSNTKVVSNAYADTLNYADVLHLKNSNSVLVQTTDPVVIANSPLYIVAPFTASDAIFFEVKVSGTYYPELLNSQKLPSKSSIDISQIDCGSRKLINDTKTSVSLQSFQTTGIQLSRGCYLFNVGQINKSLVYSIDSLNSQNVPQLNLDYAFSHAEFPLNQQVHNYYVKFNLSKQIKYEDVVIWTKICGDPKTFIINNSSNACMYDLIPLHTVEDTTHYAGNFNISGNRLYSSKGIGFKYGVTPVVTDLELYAVKNPLIALKNSKIQDNTPSESIPVTFSKIDPTKYLIQLPTNINSEFVLFFGQNFDDGWMIKPATKKYTFDTTIQEYPEYNVTEKTANCSNCAWPLDPTSPIGIHVKADNFGNGWLLDPKDADFSNTLVLEFYPQQFYILGLYISLLVLLTMPVVIYLGRKFIK